MCVCLSRRTARASLDIWSRVSELHRALMPSNCCRCFITAGPRSGKMYRHASSYCSRDFCVKSASGCAPLLGRGGSARILCARSTFTGLLSKFSAPKTIGVSLATTSVGLQFSLPSFTPIMRIFCLLYRETSQPASRLLFGLFSHLAHRSSRASIRVSCSFRPLSVADILLSTVFTVCLRSAIDSWSVSNLLSKFWLSRLIAAAVNSAAGLYVVVGFRVLCFCCFSPPFYQGSATDAVEFSKVLHLKLCFSIVLFCLR